MDTVPSLSINRFWVKQPHLIIPKRVTDTPDSIGFQEIEQPPKIEITTRQSKMSPNTEMCIVQLPLMEQLKYTQTYISRPYRMHFDTINGNLYRNFNQSTLEWGVKGNRHEVERAYQSKKSPSQSTKNFQKFQSKSPFQTMPTSLNLLTKTIKKDDSVQFLGDSLSQGIISNGNSPANSMKKLPKLVETRIFRGSPSKIVLEEKRHKYFTARNRSHHHTSDQKDLFSLKDVSDKVPQLVSRFGLKRGSKYKLPSLRQINLSPFRSPKNRNQLSPGQYDYHISLPSSPSRDILPVVFTKEQIVQQRSKVTIPADLNHNKMATVSSSIESLEFVTEVLPEKYSKEVTQIRFNAESHFNSIKEKSERGTETPRLGNLERVGVTGVIIERSRMNTRKSKFEEKGTSTPNRTQEHFKVESQPPKSFIVLQKTACNQNKTFQNSKLATLESEIINETTAEFSPIIPLKARLNTNINISSYKVHETLDNKFGSTFSKKPAKNQTGSNLSNYLQKEAIQSVICSSESSQLRSKVNINQVIDFVSNQSNEFQY